MEYLPSYAKGSYLSGCNGTKDIDECNNIELEELKKASTITKKVGYKKLHFIYRKGFIKVI